MSTIRSTSAESLLKNMPKLNYRERGELSSGNAKHWAYFSKHIDPTALKLRPSKSCRVWQKNKKRREVQSSFTSTRMLRIISHCRLLILYHWFCSTRYLPQLLHQVVITYSTNIYNFKKALIFIFHSIIVLRAMLVIVDC